jgi:hypothetical protein
VPDNPPFSRPTPLHATPHKNTPNTTKGLDWWTFEVIVMLSGLLPAPDVTMAMMGITFNVHALCFFAAHGLSGAASTRVGNDLGAGRPRVAWLTTQVAVLLGTVVMAAFAALLLLGRARLGRLFSSDDAVALLTAQAVPPLAVSLVGEGANTVLSGIMRGCGRQRIGATVNLVRVCVFWGGVFWGVWCFFVLGGVKFFDDFGSCSPPSPLGQLHTPPPNQTNQYQNKGDILGVWPAAIHPHGLLGRPRRARPVGGPRVHREPAGLANGVDRVSV